MVGLCRLCASLKKTELLAPINDKSSEICQKLGKCCQLQIEMQDHLPKSICRDCSLELNLSYKFYSKVQEAQETLLALYPSHVTDNSKRHEASEKSFRISLVENSETIGRIELLESQSSGKCHEKNDENNANCSLPAIRNVETSSEPRNDEDYLQEVYGILGMTKITGVHQPHIDTLKEQHMVTESEEHEYLMEEKTVQSKSNIRKYEKKKHFTKDVQNKAESNQSKKCANKTNDELVSIELSDEYDVLKDAPNEEINIAEEMSLTHVDVEDDDYYDVIVEDLEIDEENVATDLEKDFSNLPTELQLANWNSYAHLCFMCDYQALNFIDLVRHANKQHLIDDFNKLQYKCYDCQKVLSHYSAFLNHVRLRHHPALKLRCDACDELAVDYQKLENHRRVICLTAKKYPDVLVCKHCCKNFHSTCGLHLHEKLLHTTGVRQEKYKCNTCSKEFAHERNLKNHETKHTQKRTFYCELCEKQFYSKPNLEAHKATHFSEKLYKCNICETRFKSNAILQNHQLIHANIKPFSCSFCSKAFRTKIEQTTHERIHTGETPLECQLCDKRFRFRSGLTAHLKVHSGIKKHSCKYCSKNFLDISNLNKHVKRKHLQEETNKTAAT